MRLMRSTALRRLGGGATLRIGLAVILVEIVVLGLLGGYYVRHLNSEIDERAAERIAAPGQLMQDGLLRFASVGDREIMTRLVGGDLVEAMVVGRDHNIFYATDPQLLGRSVEEYAE